MGLVFAFLEIDLDRVWRGSKSTTISRELQTIGSAFALQRLRCFLMAESISLRKVEGSGNDVKGRTSIGEYNSHYAVVLEFRHPREVGVSSIVLLEVLTTGQDQYSVV